MVENLATATEALRAQVLRLYQVRVRVPEVGALGQPLRVHVDGSWTTPWASQR